MTLKREMLEVVDEMFKSMCKTLVLGEEPAVAQTEIAVLRSDQNDFQEVDHKYSYISCSSCIMGTNTSAKILLGPALKERFTDWMCGHSYTCNGACVASAQVK